MLKIIQRLILEPTYHYYRIKRWTIG